MFRFNMVILVILILLSVYFDLKERRIPNFLTLPIIIWGIISSGIYSGLNGFIFSVSGLLLGFAVFFIPFVLGGMGAGDVKLMAAVGALMGWNFIIRSALWTAISGGVIVIIYTLYKGELRNVLGSIVGWCAKPILSFLYLKTGNNKILKIYERIINRETFSKNIYIPYGLAIAIGTMLVLIGNIQGKTF